MSKPRFETFDALYQKVLALHASGDYQAADDLIASEQHFFPINRSFILFTRACLAGRMNQEKSALGYLKEMLDDGYWLAEAAWEDEDFGDIRRTDAFKKLKAKAMQQMQTTQTDTRPELLTVLPDVSDKAHPLVMALHGNFSSVRWHRAHWRPVANLGWLLGMPQSTQVSNLDTEGGVGYVWNDVPKAESELLTHYQALTTAYNIDESQVVLGGFSRGAEMALYMALSGAIPAKGVIAICPGGPLTTEPELWEPIVAAGKGRDIHCHLIMGEQDQFVEGTEKLADLLRQAEIPTAFESHPDLGHDFPDDFKMRLGLTLASIVQR